MRLLLDRPAAGGWVPPPDPLGPAAAEPRVPSRGRHAAPDDGWLDGWRADVGRPSPDVVRSDGRTAVGADPAPSVAPTGPPASAELGDGSHGVAASASPSAALFPSAVSTPAEAERPVPDRASRLLDRLPVAVRTGRFDPGRRGAVALVLIALLAALVAGGVVLRGRPQEVAVPQVLASGSPLPGVTTAPEPGQEVVVSVGGKVKRPGVVRLPVGSRVDDAVRAAGGPVEGATTGLLNLARRLVDGEQVLVGVDPPPGTAPGAAGAGPAAPGGLLDLNTATVGDLDALPGIGPVLAQRIVDWRSENQRFASVDQLREVSGIGEKTFADLRSEVTV